MEPRGRWSAYRTASRKLCLRGHAVLSIAGIGRRGGGGSCGFGLHHSHPPWSVQPAYSAAGLENGPTDGERKGGECSRMDAGRDSVDADLIGTSARGDGLYSADADGFLDAASGAAPRLALSTSAARRGLVGVGYGVPLPVGDSRCGLGCGADVG